MRQKINITLYDNLNDYDFDNMKQAYIECNQIPEDEVDDIMDEDVWDFISEEQDRDWDDLLANIEFSGNNVPCVVTGSLGLWTGRHTIGATPCDNLVTAIRKCAGSCDYVTVKQENGHLTVSSAHHDGTNCFEIHLLSKRGNEALYRLNNEYGNANLEKPCYHKAIKGYVF